MGIDRQEPVRMSVRGAVVKAVSPAKRGPSVARSLDDGEHTRNPGGLTMPAEATASCGRPASAEVAPHLATRAASALVEDARGGRSFGVAVLAFVVLSPVRCGRARGAGGRPNPENDAVGMAVRWSVSASTRSTGAFAAAWRCGRSRGPEDVARRPRQPRRRTHRPRGVDARHSTIPRPAPVQSRVA